MPSIAQRTTSLTPSATATGLTGLDQAVAAFSWGAWVYRSHVVTGGRPSLWCHADNQGSPRNGITIRGGPNGDPSFSAQTGSANAVFSQGGMMPLGWSHLAFRYDGAQVWHYVNGHFRVSSPLTAVPTVSGTRVTQIGFNQSGSSSLFLWRLWDIRVFPALALTDAEMRELADPRSIVRGCKQRLCFERNWRAAGSGAVTLFDESGNGNNLTTSGTTLHADTDDEPNWRRILRMRRIPYARPSGLTQAMLPDGTVSNTGWTPSGAGSIHAAVNDASDSTFAYATADTSVAEVSFADPATTLASVTSLSFTVRHKAV